MQNKTPNEQEFLAENPAPVWATFLQIPEERIIREQIGNVKCDSGKHSTQTRAWVVQNDRTYIAWCRGRPDQKDWMKKLLAYDDLASGRKHLTAVVLLEKRQEAFSEAQKIWKAERAEMAEALRAEAKTAVQTADENLKTQKCAEAEAKRALDAAQEALEASVISQDLKRKREDLLAQAGLNDSQLDAIRTALRGPGVTTVQGPPGTGKTRTIATLAQVLLEAEPTAEPTPPSSSPTQASGPGLVSPRQKLDADADRPPGIGRLASQKSFAPRRVVFTASSNKAVFNMLEKIAEEQSRLPDDLRCPGTIVLVGVEDKVPDHLRPYFVHTRFGDVFENTAGVEVEAVQRLVRDAPDFCSKWGLTDDATKLQTLRKDFEVAREKRKAERERRQQLQETDKGNAAGNSTLKALTLREFLQGTKKAQPDDSTRLPEKLDLEDELLGGANYIFSTLACLGRPKIAEAIDEKSACLISRMVKKANAFALSGTEKRDAEAAKDLAIVVDEAAQATEADTFLALSLKPSRLILVGDPQQLSATVIHSRALEQRGYARSLQERMQALAEQGPCFGSRRPEVCFLETQYRMHPEISAFPNLQYYGGRLQDGTQPDQEAPGLMREFFSARRRHGLSSAANELLDKCAGQGQRYIVVNHSGNEEHYGASFSAQNPREAELVARTCFAITPAASAESCVALTFYQAQRRLLENKLQRLASDGRFSNRSAKDKDTSHSSVVHTVDSFQGSESDVVLLSFVRSTSKRTFLAEPTRLNVALTRARGFAIIFANVEKLLGERPGQIDSGRSLLETPGDADTASADQENQVRAVLEDAKRRGLVVSEAVWEEVLNDRQNYNRFDRHQHAGSRDLYSSSGARSYNNISNHSQYAGTRGPYQQDNLTRSTYNSSNSISNNTVSKAPQPAHHYNQHQVLQSKASGRIIGNGHQQPAPSAQYQQGAPTQYGYGFGNVVNAAPHVGSSSSASSSSGWQPARAGPPTSYTGPPAAVAGGMNAASSSSSSSQHGLFQSSYQHSFNQQVQGYNAGRTFGQPQVLQQVHQPQQNSSCFDNRRSQSSTLFSSHQMISDTHRNNGSRYTDLRDRTGYNSSRAPPAGSHDFRDGQRNRSRSRGRDRQGERGWEADRYRNQRNFDHHRDDRWRGR
ncbi:unnamed protein product [Amoebophrya sp. A120]|nr:unnamed protein product [Amoebophrya sp. A120]|eukprot:GSA120T00012975001.1